MPGGLIRANFHQKSEDLRSIDFNYMIRLEIGPKIRHGGVVSDMCTIEKKTANAVVVWYRSVSGSPVRFKVLLEMFSV